MKEESWVTVHKIFIRDLGWKQTKTDGLSKTKVEMNKINGCARYTDEYGTVYIKDEHIIAYQYL